jgi:hypothetical protein
MLRSAHHKEQVIIDPHFISRTFAGRLRDELLLILERYSISSIVLTRHSKLHGSIKLNFSRDVSHSPVTVARKIQADIKLTHKGFHLTKFVGVQILIEALIAIRANITGLQYNGLTLVVEHDSILPNIPFPPGIEVTNVAQTASRALSQLWAAKA